MKFMLINDLLNRKIDWQKTKESPYLFTANVEGQVFMLRLNDFPEEPLCTLIWSDGEQDLDDLGRKWTLPRHRSNP